MVSNSSPWLRRGMNLEQREIVNGAIPRRSRGLRRAFTLIEVVLAIGLAVTVLALLATAIDLYLVRVDADRTKVESAQLARVLLAQIADDIRAARYYSPDANSRGSNSEGSTLVDSTDSSQVLGISGTATEMRIDRGARWQWERTTREVDPSEDAAADEMPQSVRYFFSDGETMLGNQLAALGVPADGAPRGYAGLYRQQTPTAARVHQNLADDPSGSTTEASQAELIAPEVLDLQLAYFDGSVLLEQWDSASQGRLPRGVEIRLTLLQQPFELAMIQSEQDRQAELRRRENSVEYRLFVRLPNLQRQRVPGARRRSRESSSQQGSEGNGSGNSGSSSNG